MKGVDKMKMTQKQILLGEILATYEEGATCYQIIEENATTLKENSINIDKINSVNATLASLVTKGLADK